MTVPTAELIVNGLLHRPDDAKGNLQFVERAIADATAAAEAEAKAALAHIRKLEANDRENQAAFERVQAVIANDTENEEAARKIAASVLGEAKANGDSHGVPNVADLMEMMKAEIERLRDERRAAESAFCAALAATERSE